MIPSLLPFSSEIRRESRTACVLKGCTSLTEFTFWEGLEEIGAGAFDGCTNLVAGPFPSSLKKIEATAFQNCKKLDPVINFPASLTEIGARAFQGCTQLTELHFKEGNDDLTIGEYAFSSSSYPLSNLQVVELPDNLTSIGQYAFYSCSKVPQFHLSDRIRTIGNSAFSGCNNARFSPMPSSLETIGSSAFNQCYQITELDLQPHNDRRLRFRWNSALKNKQDLLCGKWSSDEY